MPGLAPRRVHPAVVRVKRGGIVLAIVFVAAVVGFRLLTERSWIESVYMVVMTIACVGLAETSRIGPELQLYFVAVVVLGVTAAGYTIGGLLQMMTEGEIERAIGLRRTSREIAGLCQHVILCGYGRMGHLLAAELARQKLPLVIIDREPELMAEAQAAGHLVVSGDATEEVVLLAAGVDRAKSLVTALANDAESVFIALTARNINKQLQIIARADHQSTQKKLIQAGADRVVMPAGIGAQRIATMLTRPTTVELFELVVDRAQLDVEVDELTIPAHSPLVGATARDSELRHKYNLLIVAVKQADAASRGRMLFNPDPDHRFAAGDTLIVMGGVQDIARFREQHGF